MLACPNCNAEYADKRHFVNCQQCGVKVCDYCLIEEKRKYLCFLCANNQ